MSFEAVGALIRTRFNTLWPTFSPVYLHHFRGQEFNPPKDDVWVRADILYGRSWQTSMGMNRNHKIVGILDVSMFIPVGFGDGYKEELADRLVSIFGSRTIQNVIFRAPTVVYAGKSDTWEMYSGTTPFEANEYR